MSAISNIVTTARPSAAVLSDREALARIIEYARSEADRKGEVVCAELLSAAQLALGLSPAEAACWCDHMMMADRLLPTS